MAVVIRRYLGVGPMDTNLALFVGTPANVSIAATYGQSVVDIEYEDTTPGLVEDLDTYMAGIGLVPSATASPRQVFTYTANGLEGALITIGAAQGFIERVTADYNVQVSLCRGPLSALKLLSLVDGSFTTISFDVELSADIQAGDVLCFTVEDRT